MAKAKEAQPMDRYLLAQAKYDKLSKMREQLSDMTDNLDGDIDYRFDKIDDCSTIEKVDSAGNGTDTAEELLSRLSSLVDAGREFQRRAARKAAGDLKKQR